MSGYPRKLDPRNKFDCTVYYGHARTHPRKLNRENFEVDPTKISRYTGIYVHENN
jgi:hypothetical protein